MQKVAPIKCSTPKLTLWNCHVKEHLHPLMAKTQLLYKCTWRPSNRHGNTLLNFLQHYLDEHDSVLLWAYSCEGGREERVSSRLRMSCAIYSPWFHPTSSGFRVLSLTTFIDGCHGYISTTHSRTSIQSSCGSAV